MTVPFLTALLGVNARLIVEVAWGANLNIDQTNWTWTDITSDLWQVSGQEITINPIARADEYSQAPPAKCTFTLDNTTGAYSKGPQSSNYPNVRPNTPVRVSVTLNGITRFVRFFGYITTWEPHDDETAKTAWVNVVAYGKLRQLQGKKRVIRNVLTRYHLRNGAVAVWPFDDGHLSTQAASAVPNGSPMSLAGVSVNFGIDVSATFPAASTVASMKVPAPGFDALTGPVNAPLSGLLHIDLWRKQAAEPDASETQLLVVDLADPGFWATVEIRARMSQISPPVVAGYIVRIGGGAVLDSTTLSTVNPFDGFFHNVHVTLQQISTTVQATLYVDGSAADSHTFLASTLPARINTVHVRNSVVAGSGSGNFDQQSVIAINTTAAGAPSYSASLLYVGETATDRLTRLCAEEGFGLPLVLTGSSAIGMGAQPADTLVNIMRECESADLGVLYDGLSQGLGYVARSAKYNQTAALTLDASLAQIDPPFEPKDDDQPYRNLWVVDRKDGSQATATDKTGPLGTDTIGTKDAQTTVNVALDGTLPDLAGWLLRLGTVNEPYRYPKLGLDLSAIPSKAADWLATTIGERIDIVNLSSVSSRHPPGVISLILEGYSEILSPVRWEVQANCSPYVVWDVDSLNGLFRLELVGQTLQSSLVPGATTLSLATAAGHQLFTTTAKYPADFPQDLVVGGWPVHVTAASGASSPQTLTISPSPNTSTIPATTPVGLLRPPALAV